ncbi:hypothetical protein QBC47DRAFT_22140 [Echria macrotheca]|uniref:Uncharacterized protein n=1 Tax=Echria macrotheca TaxID=438768 RepID=A0AAJ0BNA2_9PEZI|nr:hypothetical protein QBC47DRAFT_22140 [Echria macrotheca]
MSCRAARPPPRPTTSQRHHETSCRLLRQRGEPPLLTVAHGNGRPVNLLVAGVVWGKVWERSGPDQVSGSSRIENAGEKRRTNTERGHLDHSKYCTAAVIASRPFRATVGLTLSFLATQMSKLRSLCRLPSTIMKLSSGGICQGPRKGCMQGVASAVANPRRLLGQRVPRFTVRISPEIGPSRPWICINGVFGSASISPHAGTQHDRAWGSVWRDGHHHQKGSSRRQGGVCEQPSHAG